MLNYKKNHGKYIAAVLTVWKPIRIDYTTI